MQDGIYKVKMKLKVPVIVLFFVFVLLSCAVTFLLLRFTQRSSDSLFDAFENSIDSKEFQELQSTARRFYALSDNYEVGDLNDSVFEGLVKDRFQRIDLYRKLSKHNQYIQIVAAVETGTSCADECDGHLSHCVNHAFVDINSCEILQFAFGCDLCTHLPDFGHRGFPGILNLGEEDVPRAKNNSHAEFPKYFHGRCLSLATENLVDQSDKCGNKHFQVRRLCPCALVQ